MRIARTQHSGSVARHLIGGVRLDREEKQSVQLRTLERDHKELERKYQSLLQAQLQLARSRNHYAALYDNAPVSIVTLSQTGAIRDVNRAGVRLLDPGQKQLAGCPFVSFIAREDRKNFIAHLSRCRSNRDAMEPMSVELKLARSQDEWPVFIEFASLPPSQKGAAFFKCVFRDITDIKETREMDRWLAAIVESFADAIIGKDTDGRIISCNQSVERLFGYTRKELTGRPMAVLIPKELQHEELQILRRLQRGEKMESYETIRRRKDGTLVPVSLTISPIRDDQGKIIGISNIAHDISGRKEGGRKLEDVLMRGAGIAGEDCFAALSRETLRYIIEEQETRNDQLNAANEEIMASNEELQSTNEELEMAREELQSTNEELTTLNDELENRNSELEKANHDLHDLLASVNIPMVILDADMKIRRFTAMAKKMFNLAIRDIGRPITEIPLLLDIPAVRRQALEVLKSLRPGEIEVTDWQGRRWSVRIGPYKTTDRGINGVVITLVDIDGIKSGVKPPKENV